MYAFYNLKQRFIIISYNSRKGYMYIKVENRYVQHIALPMLNYVYLCFISLSALDVILT